MTSPADPLALPHGPAWPNRMALAPLTNRQSNPDGTLSDDERRWLVARAQGGFGLTMTCATYVAPAGQAWTGQLGISSDTHVAGLARLAEEIRSAGGRSSVQLHHGGLRADAAVSGVPLVAPWDDDAKGARALTTAEVHRAVDDFVAGAIRAEQAGFDGVEVHGAHGYLVCQFLDGRHNGEGAPGARTDGYGGSLENRSRFLLEIIDGIRASTGPDFQLGLRLTPERHGIVLAEGRETARRVLADGLLDYLDLSLWDVFKAPHQSGNQSGSQTGTQTGEGLLIEQFTDLPRGGTALGVAGKILSAADVQWCLDHGADVALVGTAAILHHDFASRTVTDAGFVSTPQPVTRAHLERESVGAAFVDYLATNWDDFVTAD